MIHEELKETFAAHDDSISFMAVIIMSCTEQTYMLLCCFWAVTTKSISKSLAPN